MSGPFDGHTDHQVLVHRLQFFELVQYKAVGDTEQGTIQQLRQTRTTKFLSEQQLWDGIAHKSNGAPRYHVPAGETHQRTPQDVEIRRGCHS